jgi:cell division protein FtsQ
MRRHAAPAEPQLFEGNDEDASTAVGESVPSGARRRADPWRTGFFALLAVGIAAAAVWLLLGSKLLVVRQVKVVGGSRLVPAAQVRHAASAALGTPLADVNTRAIAARVEQLNTVAWAQVSKSWPDTLVITVRQRIPVLAVASGTRFQLIDGTGVTVRWAARKPAGMPLLAAPPAVLRGSPAIRAAAAVLAELPSGLRSRVRSVAAPASDAVTLRLAGRINILWGGTGQARLKLAELGRLMRSHARYYDISDPNTPVTQG